MKRSPPLPPKPLTFTQHQDIHRLKFDRHRSHRDIAKLTGVSVGAVSKYARTPLPDALNKKQGEVSWREWTPWIKQGQALKKKASWSQTELTLKLGDGSCPVLLLPHSDQHMGSWGTDYDTLRQHTDELLALPNVYLGLVGDYCEHAIKFRSVLESAHQILTPELQSAFFESWLEEVKDRVAFATWDNHSVERQERQAGESSIKVILSRRVPYFNGIGHADVQVGRQVYRIAVSHKFRGVTQMDSTAGCKRYMRLEAQDRELAIQGDAHKPGLSVYTEGALKRVAICTGTLHLNSGYAKRHFSLYAHPIYPCVELYPDEHLMVGYWSVAEYLKAKGLKR